jgi:transcriptional regulator
MHPNRAFAWEDEAELRAFIESRAFALISAVVDGAPLTAQAPLAVHPDGSLRFHLARANGLVPHLDGARVVAAVLGDHAYISPDWYGSEDQVPTWNYRLVEVSGRARRLDEAGLVEQIDTLSAAQEARLAPKAPWTSAKMNPARLAAMLKAIVGFSIDAPVMRGVAKLGQNKKAEEREGAIAALRALGSEAMANAMQSPLPAGERESEPPRSVRLRRDACRFAGHDLRVDRARFRCLRHPGPDARSGPLDHRSVAHRGDGGAPSCRHARNPRDTRHRLQERFLRVARRRARQRAAL